MPLLETRGRKRHLPPQFPSKPTRPNRLRKTPQRRQKRRVNILRKKLRSESAAKLSGTESVVGDAVFDPFAFSVVVVITKEGRDGLARKLQSVASAADLKSLAKAQHVALPEGDLSADELRAAIVEGALQRIANRKAAAS